MSVDLLLYIYLSIYHNHYLHIYFYLTVLYSAASAASVQEVVAETAKKLTMARDDVALGSSLLKLEEKQTVTKLKGVFSYLVECGCLVAFISPDFKYNVGRPISSLLIHPLPSHSNDL